MLVATASLSLIAPIAAQASDYNIEGINSYSRSKPSSKKQKQFNSNSFSNQSATLQESVDGLTIKKNEFNAGSFSDTVVFDGKAVAVLGAIDGNDTLSDSDDVTFAYIYQMNLNTSFTGDDNLYMRLKTGDGWAAWGNKPGTYHIENKDGSDKIKLDKMWYTFPVGDKFTATVGPLIENYYMLAATPSVYKPGILKAFKLGGHGSAFGASTSVGAGLTYAAGNGFAVSTTANSKKGDLAGGLFTDQDQTKINTQVAYTADNYHVSATYSINNSFNSWKYYSTKDAANGFGTVANNSSADSIAFRAWWRPDETGTSVPSVSVGFDTMSFENHTVKEASGYMIGLNWADMFLPDDKIGFALGQPIKATEASAGNTLSEVDPLIWEAYYSFRPNDSIEITPGIFGGTDTFENTDEDLFGVHVSTTFKF